METCVDLFEVADFLILNKLRECACRVLQEHLTSRAKRIQLLIRSETRIENPRYRSVGTPENRQFLARFFDIVGRVYRLRSTASILLRDVLLEFPHLTCSIILRSRIFGSRLFTDRALSEFAQDILEEMVAESESDHEVYIPRICGTCNQAMEFAAEFDVFMSREVAMQGFCAHCTGIGDLSDGLRSLGLADPS